jgi:hypothetical protein
MAMWIEFEHARPEMAAAGRTLMYQFGVPLGYLATVRADGAPRVHPMCPILAEGRLYALIIPSPKRRDLLRDRRYALHTFPAVDRDDEFCVAGCAVHRDDRALVVRVRAAFLATGGHSTGDEMLFEFDLERALLATYKKRGEPDAFPPRYTHWRAPAGRTV